jgi:hypothetical protein
MLKGGNLVKQIMHAPWCITGCPSNNFHQDHMQRTSMGGQQALFRRKFMVACEAKEHGHESKKRHKVEGPIMQAKEWMREFGRCNLWSTRARKSQREDRHVGGKPSQGRHEATQAGQPGRPASPTKAPVVLVFSRQVAHSTLCLCARSFSPEPP